LSLWVAAITAAVATPGSPAPEGLGAPPPQVVLPGGAAVGPSQVGIYNGTVAAADEFPEVVGLGVFGLTVCTGVLITPRLVLTAAHCSVDLPTELAVELGNAFFGPTPYDSVAVGIDDLWLHPDYVRLNTDGSGDYTLGEADVGLILLSDDAPVDPEWFRVAPFAEEAVLGEEVVSVGWGLAEDGTSHTKRSAVLTLDELDEWHLVSAASTNDNRASICSGDSGGPKYGLSDRGEMEVWGVHSWGSTNCKGESGSTRTDQVAPWILDVIEEVHGSRDRCEVHGLYDDGVCDDTCGRADPDCRARSEGPEDVRRARSGAPESAGCRVAPGAPLGALWGLVALGLRRRRA